MSRKLDEPRNGVPVIGCATCEYCGSAVNYRVWFPGERPVESRDLELASEYFVMLHQRICNG